MFLLNRLAFKPSWPSCLRRQPTYPASRNMALLPEGYCADSSHHKVYRAALLARCTTSSTRHPVMIS